MNDSEVAGKARELRISREHTTSARRGRHVPVLALLLAFLTLAGCTAAGSASRGTADPAPTFDSSPSAVVIAVGDLAPYNPSNQQGSTGIQIHGDGSVTVTGGKVDPGKRITPQQLQQLAARARDMGLLDQPDLGDPVYDAGETDVHLELNGKKVSLSVGPSGMGSYSDAQKAARQAVRDFASLVRQAIA